MIFLLSLAPLPFSNLPRRQGDFSFPSGSFIPSVSLFSFSIPSLHKYHPSEITPPPQISMPQDSFPHLAIFFPPSTVALWSLQGLRVTPPRSFWRPQPSPRPRERGSEGPLPVAALGAAGRGQSPRIYHRAGGETLSSVRCHRCPECQQRCQPLLRDRGGSDLPEARVPAPACARVGPLRAGSSAPKWLDASRPP